MEMWMKASVAAAFLAGSPVQAADEAAAAVDTFLSAVGGREAWAALTGAVNDSQQNRPAEPTVVRAVITMDFTAPRFRIETTAEHFHTVRVIDGAKSWRKTRDGVIEDVPADLYADDMRWYGAHIYRTIHRLARRDPALSARLGPDGRLEIIEDGARLLWLKLDARGEPYAFGARDDEKGSICGPWEFDAAGVNHPIWVSNTDGTWRASAKSVTLNPVVTDAILARPPQSR